ncbi:MAG: FAD-binding oxidoreductase [Candidatus Stahlbacteria bacterium]|nr:FAD-binding oxidoreductase [Candidatus Stahlbacteria bacterium]
MAKVYDSIVIGGGILGCATAYEMAKLGSKVLLVDKGYIGSGSTGRCIGGIRQQFSTPATIRLAMESVSIFEQMEGIEWYPSGYLFLAQSEQEKIKYLEVMKIQQEMGLEVEFIEKKDVLSLVPMLNGDRVIGGTYCKRDGQANPFLVLKFYVDGIKKLGGKILTYSEAIKICNEGNFFTTTLRDINSHKTAEFKSSIVVNAGGPWLNEVNSLIKGNQQLPVISECHEALITEPTFPLFDPMLVSYSPSCYFQQLRGTGQIIGCYTPEQPIKGIDHNSTYNFASEFSSRVLKLIPGLADLRVLRSWTGWYEMTPDGNPIMGETNIKGYWVIGGASGHGFMFGPALGKCLAELICTGKACISVKDFLLTRNFEEKEKFS